MPARSDKKLVKDKLLLVPFTVTAWNSLKAELLRWHETFELLPLQSLAQ